MTTGPAEGFGTTGISNHPGHADQKSHGRRGEGAGGEVRDALAGARTLGEINAAASAEAKRITGRDIPFDMTGSDPQIAREHSEGVLKVLERYPESSISRVETVSLAGRAPDGSTPYAMIRQVGPADHVAFASEYAGNPTAYHESLAKSQADGWYPSGHATPTGIAVHEAGHMTGPAWETGPRAARIAAEHTGVGETIDSHVRARLGSYATTNGEELAAVAFTDVVLNGDGASQLAKDIYAMNDAEYRKITGT